MKEKRSTKAKSKQLAQVTIVAKSLVCDASLALDAVGALRLHASYKHITLISTPVYESRLMVANEDLSAQFTNTYSERSY